MDDSQTSDLVQLESQNHISHRFILTAVLLVSVFATGNVYLPMVFWNTKSGLMYIPLSLFGVCVTQIVLLGIWAALGTMAIKYRFPLTLGLAIFLAMSYVWGMRIPDDNLPRSVALMLIAFAVLVYFALFVGLRLARRQTGMHLQILGHQPAIVGRRSKQVGVGYLLGATTIVAFAITGLRSLIPSDGIHVGGPPVWEILKGGLFFALAFNSIAIAAVVLVFSQKQVVSLCVLLLLTLLLPWLQLLVYGFRFLSEEWVTVSYSFFLGHETSLLLALTFVRCSGVSLMFESRLQPLRSG